MATQQNHGELYPTKGDDINRYYIDSAIPGAPKHTGFVPNLADEETKATQAFRIFSTHYESPKLAYGSTFQQQATIRIHTATPVNQAFFSEANIKYLQDETRYRVWVKSDKKHTIDPQRLDDLKIIMSASSPSVWTIFWEQSTCISTIVTRSLSTPNRLDAQ